MGDKIKSLDIQIIGSKAAQYRGYRSTNDEMELYKSIGNFSVKEDVVLYDAPPHSVTTFYSY